MSAADDYPGQDELERLGQQYMDENPDMYDTADLEALGAAVYVEQAPQDDAKAFADIAEYIFHADDFHDQRFKFYKEVMGGEQFDEDIVGQVSDLVDEVNGSNGRNGAYSVLWESLYREKAQDLDEANEVIEGMLEELSELEENDQGDIIFTQGNVNWGNQVLSERPPNNLNMGNQVVLDDLDGWTRDSEETETQRGNMDEMYEWWDEEMETGNPDPL